jgi:hypothetical protein
MKISGLPVISSMTSLPSVPEGASSVALAFLKYIKTLPALAKII